MRPNCLPLLTNLRVINFPNRLRICPLCGNLGDGLGQLLFRCNDMANLKGYLFNGGNIDTTR